MSKSAINQRVRVLGEQIDDEALSLHDCRHLWDRLASKAGQHVVLTGDALALYPDTAHRQRESCVSTLNEMQISNTLLPCLKKETEEGQYTCKTFSACFKLYTLSPHLLFGLEILRELGL